MMKMLRAAAIAFGVLLCVASPSVAQLQSKPFSDLTIQTQRFSASVINSTAVILTEIVAAPATGLSLYITDVFFSASVTSTTAADSYPVLKYGTGSNCATGTVAFWAVYTISFDVGPSGSLQTPIKLPAGNALCWMHAIAGNKNVVVNGYIAP